MRHELDLIERNPKVMGGKPCIKGTRVTVGTIVGLVASEQPIERILSLYPYLTKDAVLQALAYAAWRCEEFEVDLDLAG